MFNAERNFKGEKKFHYIIEVQIEMHGMLF